MINFLKKHIKKFLVGIGVLSVALAAGTIFIDTSPVILPETININGQEIRMAWTDDNTNENLIIRSSREKYFNPFGKVSIPFSVSNLSRKSQNIKIVISVANQNWQVKEIKKFVQNTFEEIPKIVIPVTATTSGKTIPARTKTTTQWDKAVLAASSADSEYRKDIKNYEENREGTFLIGKNETLFFLAEVETKEEGEFFIEAFGDNAYGHLDPWTYEQLFNTLNDGDLAGQDSWVDAGGGTNFDVQTTTAFEGAKAVQCSGIASDMGVKRNFASITAGEMFISIRANNTNNNGWILINTSEFPLALSTAAFGIRAGAIKYYDGTSWNQLIAFTADTWFTFDVKFDDSAQPDKQNIRVRKQGESWGSWTGWVNSPASWSEVTNISFYTDYGGSVMSFYIDTVTPTDPTPIEYILTAALGTFTLTGVAALLKIGYTLVAALGTFTLTGVAATFKKAFAPLVAALGTFTLTGVSAILTKALKMAAALGTFTLTGVAATFKKAFAPLVAALGTFTLTGVDAILKKGYGIAAAVGSFTLTGIDATFNKTLKLTATVGTFTLTGIDAILARAYTFTAAVGSFTFTGVDATFQKALKIAAAVGSFTLTGINITLTIVRKAGYIVMRSKQEDYPIKLDSKQQDYPITFNDGRTL